MSGPSAGETSGWRPDPRGWGLGDLAALAVWTFAVAAFFRDAVALREALFYFDITEINYPYREFLAQEMRLGRFSRWFPGLYCGMPLYSESQAGYWHPLKPLLYPWMATWKAFNLDTVLSVWLTGLGTYGWLRRHVGPRGALTGASVFGLSGFVWAHLIHTSMNNALTSVPFAVWALEWAWERGRLAGVALGGFAIAFQVFAGHLQDTLLTALALGLYAGYRATVEVGLGRKLMALGMATGLVGLGVAISAVQWVPSKELLDRSPRAGGLSWANLTYGSWHPELLPTLVVREAYGTRARDTDWMDGFYPYHEMNAYLGLTALALAVIGAAAYRDRWAAFWVILAALGSVLMLGKFTLLYDHAHQIPILGSSRIPVRLHLWVSLAVAALAAVGVDRLGRDDAVRLRWAFGLIAFLVVASVPILLYVYSPILTEPRRWTPPYHAARYRWLGRELTIGLVRTFLLGSTGLGACVLAARTARPGLRGAACGVLPLVVIADLLGSHWRDVPTITPRLLDQPPPERPGDQGRPGSRPGLRGRREIGRKAGLRLGAGRLPGHARRPGLEPRPSLGPRLRGWRDPDHPPPDARIHRQRQARPGEAGHRVGDTRRHGPPDEIRLADLRRRGRGRDLPQPRPPPCPPHGTPPLRPGRTRRHRRLRPPPG